MLFLRKRKSTLPTIRAVLVDQPPADFSAFEKLEYEFFARLWFPNGTAKTTYPNRLNNINEWIQTFLPKTQPVQLMDVAVSTGITTLDWMNSLDRMGRPYHLVAGDAYLHAIRISFAKHFECLVDPSFRPLYFDWFGRGFPAALRTKEIKRHEFAILNGYYRMLLKLHPQLTRVVPNGVGVYSGKRVHARPCLLASARFLARVGQNMELVEDDLSRPAGNSHWYNRFDVVRAANLLNRAYFNDQELGAMMRELGSRLKEGGVLVVCRTWTEDGQNRATAFRRVANQLKIEGRILEGSDVEALATDLTLLS